MIGGYAEVRSSLVDHLQNRVEHAYDGAESAILPVGCATQSVEVTEKLVRPVDQVDDQKFVKLGAPQPAE